MASPPALCAVGDFCWDVVIRTPTELQHAGDTFGEVSLMAGGSAANVAVWAARCGATAHFVGKVGDDELGTMAHRNLASEGVRDHLVGTADHPTGAVASFVDQTGERSMVSGHGADHFLTPEDLPTDVLTSVPHLHLTGWSFFVDPPRSAAVEAARLAKAAGASLSFDPSSFQLIDEMGVDQFLAMTTALNVDLVFPNRDEAQALTGESDPEAMAERVAELYQATVALKLDADGALIHSADERLRVPAPPIDAVDATGAGDAFAGAYLARSGADSDAAAAFACAVASWVVAREGARPAPDAELQDLLGR